MGEVYLAEDSNLKRQVAIKVLPQIFALDKGRLARFEREARLLASLNHPNVAIIHGLEKSDDQQFLVMELIEGETLHEKLRKGPLNFKDTLVICKQIAEGLESAHEKGIIHRDLKPANVKITPEGKVKILDFGIAKVFQDQSDESDPITDEMTRPGLVIGTAPYMSPEQAKGERIDKRTDIWAFGCILYQCLTGKRAFKGDTTSEMLASILKDELDWKDIPSTTPSYIRTLIDRCLQRDPMHRLRDIGDARIEIEDALSKPSEIEPSSQAAPSFSRKAIPLLPLLLIAVTVITALLVWILKPAPSRTVLRALIELQEEQVLAGENYLGRPARAAMALSPDGKNMVYCAINENPENADNPILFLRALDRTEAAPIPGTEGGIGPFFSPDGKWLGFWADNELKKIPLNGGNPITICNTETYYGASWGTKDTIIFAKYRGGLWKVPAAGGSPELLTTAEQEKGEFTHRLPHILPGEKAVLFTVMPYYYGVDSHIEVLSLENEERKILLEEGADARFTGIGHLIFAREGTLMAVPFDPRKLEVGEPVVPVIDNVMHALNARFGPGNSGIAQYSFSKSGDLLYIPGTIYPEPENSLIWFDRKGQPQPLTNEKGDYYGPRISPDGQRVAHYTVGRERNIWVLDISRGTTQKLTFEGQASRVIWAPDGKSLTFGLAKFGPENIYMQPWDGSAEMERLTSGENDERPQSWSPDGKHLAFVERHPTEGHNIWIFHMEDRQIRPFLKTDFTETCPEFSPDGRWLAYVSNESGRDEVYVGPFPGPGGKILISNNGGSSVAWAPDGRELFYHDLSGTKLMAVEIKTEPQFTAGKPRLLFEADKMVRTAMRSYDVSRDGQRFLMQEDYEEKTTSAKQIKLVLNWFEELDRLSPARK
jgi:serine/threonine-protein kinase